MLKDDLRCPTCQGIKIGHLESVSDVGDHREARASDIRALGRYIYKEYSGSSRVQRVGAVEAYVCTECGYFEEYVKAPTSIPWESLHGFTWCRKARTGVGAYRQED